MTATRFNPRRKADQLLMKRIAMLAQAFAVLNIDASKRIAAQTRSPVADVIKFTFARTRFQDLNGLLDIYFDTEADREIERAKHADIFKSAANKRQVILEDPNVLISYVARTTDLDRAAIARMYREEGRYLRTKGITRPDDKYRDFTSWVSAVKSAGGSQSLQLV